MRKTYLLLTILFSCLIASATTYKVGSTQLYKTPNLLYKANVVQNGDIIEIDAETYTGNHCLAVWNKNDLLIKGIGGKPHLVANGAYILGKGIWVLSGDNITVENIEFDGASVPDKNGAGIRLDGNGLTVKSCYFHDNENGILTNNSGLGTVHIEYSEFDNNGYGKGQSHNLYIGHINKLIFKYNYSHHTNIGHNLKSRAEENYVLYNRIMDEQTGNSSRLIDLPSGGFSIIMGNSLMQGVNAPNNNMVGYGLEGLSNTLNEVYIINNTFVSKRSSCLFLHMATGTPVVNISNNIFAGAGSLLNGVATTKTNNFISTSISSLNFVDESNYDYSLEADSPAKDYGVAVSSVNGNSLTPDHSYLHPQSEIGRNKLNAIDAGAYEYNTLLSITDKHTSLQSTYPNPFTDKISIITEGITLEKADISIYNYLGQDVTDLVSIGINEGVIQINTSNISSGMYLLKTKNAVNKVCKSLVK